MRLFLLVLAASATLGSIGHASEILCSAIYTGTATEVETLLANGEDVNSTCTAYRSVVTPFSVLMRAQNTAIIKDRTALALKFIEMGANPDGESTRRGSWGRRTRWTNIDLACQESSTLLYAFLGHGAQPSPSSKCVSYVLNFSSLDSVHKIELTDDLISRGWPDNGQLSFILQSTLSEAQKIKRVQGWKFDPTSLSPRQYLDTYLSIGSLPRSLNIVKALEVRGADPRSTTGLKSALLPLIEGLNKGDAMPQTIAAAGAIVRSFVTDGVSFESDGGEPLFRAVSSCIPAILTWAIDSKVNLNQVLFKDAPPLILAIRRNPDCNSVGTVKQLVEAGANVNLPNWLGQTPACVARIYSRKDVSNYLTMKNADVGACAQ